MKKTKTVIKHGVDCTVEFLHEFLSSWRSNQEKFQGLPGSTGLRCDEVGVKKKK